MIYEATVLNTASHKILGVNRLQKVKLCRLLNYPSHKLYHLIFGVTKYA